MSRDPSKPSPSDVEDPKLQKLPLPSRLSPSRALDFQQCPQAFYYKAVEKRRDPANIHTARGTLIHDACERTFDLPREERTPEAVIEIMREIWPEMRVKDQYKHLFAEPPGDGSMPEGGDEDEFLATAEQLCRNWFEVERPWNFDPDDRERWLKTEVGGVPVIGVLDRATRWGEGNLAITDYKSGKAPKPQYERKAFFGLRVYAALYRELTGETPTMLRLVHLKDPKVLTNPCNDRVCDSTIRELGELWKAINEAWRRNNWPTKTGPLCNWCSFQDICPAWNDDMTVEAEPGGQAA